MPKKKGKRIKSASNMEAMRIAAGYIGKQSRKLAKNTGALLSRAGMAMYPTPKRKYKKK